MERQNRSNHVTYVYHNNAFNKHDISREDFGSAEFSSARGRSSGYDVPSERYTYVPSGVPFDPETDNPTLKRSNSYRELEQEKTPFYYVRTNKPQSHIGVVHKLDKGQGYNTVPGRIISPTPVRYDNVTGAFHSVSYKQDHTSRQEGQQILGESHTYDNPRHVSEDITDDGGIRKAKGVGLGVQTTNDAERKTVANNNNVGETESHKVKAVGLESVKFIDDTGAILGAGNTDPSVMKLPAKPVLKHEDLTVNQKIRNSLEFTNPKLYAKIKRPGWKRAMLGTEKLPIGKRFCFNWICVAFVGVCMLFTIIFPIIHFVQYRSGNAL